MVDVLESEVYGGCLVVIWDSPCKASLGTRDDSGEGPSDAQVSNRVIGCESISKKYILGFRIEPTSSLRCQWSPL